MPHRRMLAQFHTQDGDIRHRLLRLFAMACPTQLTRCPWWARALAVGGKDDHGEKVG